MEGTFADALKGIINYYGFESNTKVADLVGLTEGTIRNYLNGTTTPSLKCVIAICGGLRLPPDVSFALVEKAGHTLGKRGLEIDFIYMHLIRCCYREGLASWNKRIQIKYPDETLP